MENYNLRLRISQEANDYPFMLKWTGDLMGIGSDDTEKMCEELYSRFSIARDCERFFPNQPSLCVAISNDKSVHLIFAEAKNKEVKGLPAGVTVVDPHTGAPK